MSDAESTRLNLNSSTQDDVQDEVAQAKNKLEELKSSRNKVFSATQSVGTEAAVSETVIADNEFADVNLNDQSVITQILQSNSAQKKEVSATTVGRMLGLVTSAEFQLLQGKLDLISTRLNSALTKLEKVSQGLSEIPTGSDLERIDVQIGALRTLLQEHLGDTGKKINNNEPGSEKVSTTRILSND